MKDLEMHERAKKNISPTLFVRASPIVPCVGEIDCSPPQDQYILRMLVKAPGTHLEIPPELAWLIPALTRCLDYQTENFGFHPFIYVTSRCGEVRSVTADEWHVDGFSVKIPHTPEQNYFWSDSHPTQILNQRFAIPEDFNGLKHNIAWYFQDNAEERRMKVLDAKKIFVIDPYVVHRRPKLPAGTHRTFFRITCVPIPIQTDTESTPNPQLPYPKYRVADIRETLSRYQGGLNNGTRCKV